MRRLLVLTVPLAVAGVLAATAFAAVVASVAIDSYEDLDDGFAGPYFTPTLDAGQPYLMTVSGTYSFWSPITWGTWTGANATNVCAGTAEELPQTLSTATSNGIVGVDPEYFFALPSGASLCPGPTPAHATNLQISLDGGSTFTHLEPINSDFNAAHSYQYLVVGLGAPAAIGFRLEDPRVSKDNYGVLMATVEAIDAGDDRDGDSFGLLGGDGLPKFHDTVEVFLGTNLTRPCADTPTADDEDGLDAWPADADDNQFVNLLDVLPMKQHFNTTSSDSDYNPRFDLQDQNGSVNILDILPFKAYFLTSCAP
jgi:hypothetical protein